MNHSEPPLSASDLYAIANGSKNYGDQLCHWCGSACDRRFIHDDIPPTPFIKSRSTARYPANAFICLGCWFWRRKRQTMPYLTGGQRDGQEALWYSWWVTEKGAWVIRERDYPALLEILANPPHRFMLALLSKPGEKNLIQLCHANDYPILRADDLLTFTVNGTPFRYCIYDLQQAMKSGDSEGKWPGVDMLFRILGRPEPKWPEIKKPGRPANPPDGKVSAKLVRKSGQKEELVVVT